MKTIDAAAGLIDAAAGLIDAAAGLIDAGRPPKREAKTLKTPVRVRRKPAEGRPGGPVAGPRGRQRP